MRHVWVFLAGLLISGLAQAQAVTPIDFVLNPPATMLTTGSRVPVSLDLAHVENLWLLNIEITYDPQKLYIIGTQSGQPLTLTGVFSSDTSTVVRNSVDGARLLYTISMLAPADPTSISGTLGNFTLYPLAAGETTLTFNVVEAIRVNFTGEGEARQAADQLFLPVAPQNLTLTITGETVVIPPELIATPLPIPTLAVQVAPSGVADSTPQLAQTPTSPALIADVPADAAPTPPLMGVGIVLIVVALSGLLALLWMRRR